MSDLPARKPNDANPALAPVASFDVNAPAHDLRAAFAEHPEVIALDNDEAISAALPRSRARKFAMESTPSGFSLHCASAGSGSTALGLLPSVYLVAKVEEHEAGTRMQLSFGFGRPQWAIARALGFATTSILAVCWALLADPGLAMGRWLLVGLFGLAVLPVVARDLARTRQHERHRRELMALATSVVGILGHGDALGERGPYRARRGEIQGR